VIFHALVNSSEQTLHRTSRATDGRVDTDAYVAASVCGASVDPAVWEALHLPTINTIDATRIPE
jgi:hypothetical protein